MPLYTISIEEGGLSHEAKSSLAAEITDFHVKLAGLDKDFVKIIFNTFPKGDGFVGGKPAAPVILTVLIRDGRSVDYKRDMALQLWSIIQLATGAQDAQMLVAIQEAPATQAMEMGQIMGAVKG